MKVTFLGTGTSKGVPEVGCECRVCKSDNVKDKRLRSSVMIETGGKRILIDATPDFREQMLGMPFEKIDGVLITHEHYDHVGGLDDMRPFERFGDIDLYVERNVGDALRHRIPYCFADSRYGGVPKLNLKEIDCKPFEVEGVEIVPIRVYHHRLPILGYRIGGFAYLTDVKTVPDGELEKLKGLDVLVVSALQRRQHISHQTLDEAVALIGKVAPRRAYLTHLSHNMGLHEVVEGELPEGVHVGYDGLELMVNG